SAALERTGCIDALGTWLGDLVGTSPTRVLFGLTFPESLPLLFVCALLIWVLVAFIRESWSPDIVVAIAVAVLLATQLLTPGEVLGVLSNSAPVTIACMFIISAALERTGCIDALGTWLGDLVGTSPTRVLFGLT
ncbi:SLC13 family permease, partial [Acinetobacter baumannii]|uniref:SLC13 family permease n=1 Tax=Acinetobacter baumannii TaxID=470 RepID=UPI001D17A7AD